MSYPHSTSKSMHKYCYNNQTNKLGNLEKAIKQIKLWMNKKSVETNEMTEIIYGETVKSPNSLKSRTKVN